MASKSTLMYSGYKVVKFIVKVLLIKFVRVYSILIVTKYSTLYPILLGQTNRRE